MTSLALTRKITNKTVTAGGFGEEISTIIGNFFMTRHILVLCMSQQDSLSTKQLVGPRNRWNFSDFDSSTMINLSYHNGRIIF